MKLPKTVFIDDIPAGAIVARCTISLVEAL